MAIVLIIAIVLGFFFGLQLGLHTSYPLLTVESGSMCVPYDGNCDGWLSIMHPFAHTLHKGDIIVVQGVNIEDLNANYPNSDIIVFHSPATDELIVHRIISKETVNGVTYFETKGDGNGSPDTWPKTITGAGLDPWDYNNSPGVPQNLVVGKVIMRIPWFGWITLLMRGNSLALPIVIGIILLLVILEFVIPIIRSGDQKRKEQNIPTANIATYYHGSFNDNRFLLCIYKS